MVELAGFRGGRVPQPPGGALLTCACGCVSNPFKPLKSTSLSFQTPHPQVVELAGYKVGVCHSRQVVPC